MNAAQRFGGDNHQAASRKMVSAADLRQFREDFDTICLARETTLEFIGHEAAAAAAAEGMKRTRRAYLDCGRAFVRMHASSGWRDQFETWDALCKATRFNRKTVYAMMAGVRAYDGLPPLSQTSLGLPSGRQLTLLAQADPEERQAVAEVAAATGNADEAFAGLREMLQEMPEADEIDECEAAKVQTIAATMALVKRHVTMLVNCLGGLGIEEKKAKRTQLGKVVALAERCVRADGWAR